MWIRERILAERRKHNHHNIDWVRIAEAKIIMQIKDIIRECPDKDYVGEFLIKKFDSQNLKNGNHSPLSKCTKIEPPGIRNESYAPQTEVKVGMSGSPPTDTLDSQSHGK